MSAKVGAKTKPGGCAAAVWHFAKLLWTLVNFGTARRDAQPLWPLSAVLNATRCTVIQCYD